MARLSGLCIFALLIASSFAQVTFTGDAEADFKNLSEEAKVTLVTVNNTNVVGQSDWMRDNGLISGWDLSSLSFQYDYKTDTLYVGLNCIGICGDADGDRNPSISTDHGNNYVARGYGPNDGPDPQYQDTPLQEISESITVTMWTNLPPNWTPSTDPEYPFKGYYPDIVFGDNELDSLEYFGAYSLPTDYETLCDGFPLDSDGCRSALELYLNNPGAAGADIISEQTIRQQSQVPGSGVREVLDIKLFAYPNSTFPDVEFAVYNLSRYGQFTFLPGYEVIRIAFSAYLGGLDDSIGEEHQFPTILEIPCFIRDSCGVCNGTNSTCLDCNGYPNGGWEYDPCGVCNDPNGPSWGGECKDCAGTILGDATLDQCGRCNGDGLWCLDCAGLVHGQTPYDACGECGGDNSTCLDCRGVPSPNHDGWEYDLCGVCGGDNSECDCWFHAEKIFFPEDTYVELADRLANHCPDTKLEVRNNRSRTLVQFSDVTYLILQEHKDESPLEKSIILNATLEFNIVKVGCGWEDADIAIHRIQEFDCSSATWDCSSYDKEGCCQQWRMIGLPPQVAASYEAATSGVQQLYNGQVGKVVFDLTEEVTAFVESGNQHKLAYILKKVCEHDAGCAWFWSSETNLSPKLRVNIKTKCPVWPKPPQEDPCPDPQRKGENANWNKW